MLLLVLELALRSHEHISAQPTPYQRGGRLEDAAVLGNTTAQIFERDDCVQHISAMLYSSSGIYELSNATAATHGPVEELENNEPNSCKSTPTFPQYAQSTNPAPTYLSSLRPSSSSPIISFVSRSLGQPDYRRREWR